MKIVFLDQDSLDQKDLDFSGLMSLGEWQAYAETSIEQLVDRARGADIVISNKVSIDASCLAALPNLKLICVAATGTNNVDLVAAAKKNVAVCNVRDYGSHSVAEHVLMLILALKRNLFHYRDAVQSGRWQKSTQFCLMDAPIGEIHNSTIGIIGYGVLGKQLEKLLQTMGAEVLIAERAGEKNIRPQRLSFHQVLQRADIISLHCPLTAETHHLIASKELSMMKNSAILINAARGGLVDEAALIEALKSRQIAAAASDVLSVEPPIEGNPLLQTSLANLIITPHIAWASLPARQRLVDELVLNIQAFQNGNIRNAV